MSEFFRNTGEYWARDNAEFEQGNPGLGARVVRSLWPGTAFGSALGSMHSAAGQGDLPGMALSAAEAIPLFGALKTVATVGKGAVKAGVQQVPNWQKFLTMLAAGSGVSLANDANGAARENPAMVDQLRGFGPTK